jgi:hypothetical protein
VRAGDAIVCSWGHEAGTVLNTIPLALPISTTDISMVGSVPDTGLSRHRFVCGQCGRPVGRVDGQEHWSVRLERGWVR